MVLEEEIRNQSGKEDVWSVAFELLWIGIWG